MLGFFVGLFGGSSAATTHEYDDSGCDNYGCDGN